MTAEQRFVLHDHRKPSPHFDLRLEEDGVLRSWAVPKGLPNDATHDRLAIAADDHELDHIDFEDEHKSIADTGTWREHDRDERRLVFTLHGRDGARRYALIHTGGTQWLLHLTKEQTLDRASAIRDASDRMSAKYADVLRRLGE